MARKIPTLSDFFFATDWIISAAILPSALSRERLSQKRGQRVSGRVKVICCHGVSGRMANC